MISAPLPSVTTNEFARALLNYSADRNDSIGRPERWGKPAPLIVDGTHLHLEMEELAEELWKAPANPIWTFLVGGPGNGKSEAVGALIRRLDSLRGQSTLADAEKSGTGRIPYSFRCALGRGIELVLLQDISVPKSTGSRPQEDLLEELSYCRGKGSHMVVCANRGMLLRAIRLARATHKFKGLVPDLERIDKRTQESSTASESKWHSAAGTSQVEYRVWPLDHESVMFGAGTSDGWLNPNGSLLDLIVAKATEEQNWEGRGCAGCAVRAMCPMYNDAAWLRDPARRKAFLQVLRHSEVLGGQRIVLREALGILSSVLVGTPSDFIEASGPVHPCVWVHERALRNRSTRAGKAGLLELTAHRVYMDLFARLSPTGLMFGFKGPAGQRERADDVWIIKAMEESESQLVKDAAAAVRDVEKGFPKQAGPSRLASHDSILRALDPAGDASWGVGVIDVDATIVVLAGNAGPLRCAIEDELVAMYQQLEDSLNNLKPHANVPQALAAMARWFSTIFLRMVGTALGRHSLSQILDDYLTLLSAPASPLESTNKEKRLADLLRQALAEAGEYQLTRDFVANVEPQSPRPEGARKRSNSPRWPANDRLALRLTSEISVVLSAAMFVDIWLRHYRLLAHWCMPPSLENLTKAWRDESVVLKQAYRNLAVVKYRGAPSLEFEVTPGAPVQVTKA